MFKDDDGNITDSLSINEIIRLRQLFLQTNPNYFDEIYGQNLPDNATGDGSFKCDPGNGDYARAMYWILYELGVQPASNDLDDLTVLSIDEIARAAEAEDDGKLYSLTPIDDYAYSFPEGKLVIANGRSRGQLSAADDVEDRLARIDATITDIPYEETYEEMGKGFLAVSNLKAFGIPLTAEYQQAMDEYLANPKSYLSTKTDSYAKFISTATQGEALIKATTNLSLSTSAIGTSLGSGSTDNFKFGLTSTNLVIHYEIMENGYRSLSYNALDNAWKNKGFFKAVENFAKGSDDIFPTEFRNLFGDYYVSCYQYGACYDAYISITTETSEQVKEVENKLTAELSLVDSQFDASADIKNSLKDTLQKAKATVTIKIVTNGLDFKAPKVAVITSADIASGYDKATAQIGDSLTQFIQAVNSNSDRSKFAPIRVKLDRWFGFFPLMMIMYQRGYNGTIPLTRRQVGLIQGFNRELKTLTGHVNVVADNPSINPSSRSDIEAEYNELIGKVKAGGEQFYKSDATVEKYRKQIRELTPKFKALSDRYVFYTKLKLAQQAKKTIYDDLKSKADALPEGDNRMYVRKMPLGNERGGSTGYEQFGISEYVTQDIDAGKTIHKQYQRNRDDQHRIEWHAKHLIDHIDYYLIRPATQLLLPKSAVMLIPRLRSAM